MKKLLALCLMLIMLSTSLLTSCSINNYKPISLKYQNSDYAPYPDGEHKSFLVDLLNNSKWHNDVAKCECDYTVIMKNDREIFYHSGCGTFIDYDFNKSLTVSEENRVKLNDYFVDAICRSEVHFFDENHRCTACGFITSEHKHTGELHMDEKSHFYQYTCGCPSNDIAELHTDYDENRICDICGYTLSADSDGVAQIVFDYEQSLRDDLAKLHTEHPEYSYYYHAVDEVHCTLILDRDASADDIVAKYDMENLFADADVSALNAIKMVSIIFKRNDFTEQMHQKVKQISEEEELVEGLFVDMYRDWHQSYMPKIEYYTDDAEELTYTETSKIISVFNGIDVILKSKDEYDAYIDELLKNAEYDYEKERINDARDLYDETFFEESALIITRMITRGSGSIKLTVNNLYVSGNKVYVVIRTDEPSIGTGDMQYAFFGFAVGKNDVANIDEVITLD